jgi:hypothetical protein
MCVGMIGLLPGQNDPSDPGKLVSQRDGYHAERLLLAELPDPVGDGRGLVLDVPHDGGGTDNEQSSQISVSLLGDAGSYHSRFGQ